MNFGTMRERLKFWDDENMTKKKTPKPKARKIKPKPKEKHTVHYCKPNSSSPEYHKTHPIMIDDVRTNKIDLWYALADGTFLHIWMKVDNKKYKSKELTPKAKKSGVRSQLHMDIYDELPPSPLSGFWLQKATSVQFNKKLRWYVDPKDVIGLA